MGISRQLLVDEPHSDCICPICQEVLEDPRETSCQHAFCHDCIAQWLQDHDTCPTCRTAVNRSHLRFLHRIWREKLYRLRVRCDRSSDGCSSVMELNRRHAHSQSCEFVHVACPNRPCSKKVARRLLREHLETCEHRMFRCEQGCGLYVSARLEKKHSCVGALKHELETVSERLDALVRDFTRMDRSLRKEKELRVNLEKESQDQSIAIRELFDQVARIKEETTKDTKKSRTSSLPRLAPLHTHMSIRYNTSRMSLSRSPATTPSRSPAMTPRIQDTRHASRNASGSGAGLQANEGEQRNGNTRTNLLTLPSIR